MEIKKQYKLLSKTTLIYLVFTFIAFFSSAVFLDEQTSSFTNDSLEYRFGFWEGKTRHYIKHNKPLERLKHTVTVVPLTDTPDTTQYPTYVDTLLQDESTDVMESYRVKTTLLKVEDKYYKATITHSMEDLVQLREDIFDAVIPAFVLLAACIVLFNFFMSGYIFKPFNDILQQMRNYKIGHANKIAKVETNTLEFKRMQDLFHQMTNRIEYDYRHLKEYTENMAHEIQTPLSVILNKTDCLISDESVMQKHAEPVKIIYDEVNHLSKLGSTLNLITKIENGEYSQADKITTKPVIEKHVAAISELAQLKKMCIKTELREEHSFVINPLLLDIIIKNLLRNALSYGSSDGPVRVTSTNGALKISNYGQPLEISKDKIFERFSNQNNGRNTSLGLGLSLVRKICNLNNLKVDYSYDEQQHVFSISSMN